MRDDTSRYAVLGMLSIRPMSGYDIKQAIGESVVHFWDESYGRIYPSLQRLAVRFDALLLSVDDGPIEWIKGAFDAF